MRNPPKSVMSERLAASQAAMERAKGAGNWTISEELDFNFERLLAAAEILKENRGSTSRLNLWVFSFAQVVVRNREAARLWHKANREEALRAYWALRELWGRGVCEELRGVADYVGLLGFLRLPSFRIRFISSAGFWRSW